MLNRPPSIRGAERTRTPVVACLSVLLAIFAVASRMRRSCFLTPDGRSMAAEVNFNAGKSF